MLWGLILKMKNGCHGIFIGSVSGKIWASVGAATACSELESLQAISQSPSVHHHFCINFILSSLIINKLRTVKSGDSSKAGDSGVSFCTLRSKPSSAGGNFSPSKKYRKVFVSSAACWDSWPQKEFLFLFKEPNLHVHLVFSVTRRSRSDSRQSLTD